MNDRITKEGDKLTVNGVEFVAAKMIRGCFKCAFRETMPCFRACTNTYHCGTGDIWVKKGTK